MTNSSSIFVFQHTCYWNLSFLYDFSRLNLHIKFCNEVHVWTNYACGYFQKKMEISKYTFQRDFHNSTKKNGLHLIFSQPKRIRLPGTYSPLLWVARRNFLYRALCSLWVKETDSALVHYYDPHGEGERLLFIVYIYIVCNCAESFTFK